MELELKKVASFIKLSLLFPACVYAGDFNSDFLIISDGEGARNVDLSYFTKATGASPGRYEVDVILNGKLVDKHVEIDFVPHNNQLSAKLSSIIFEQWGIDSRKVKLSDGHSGILEKKDGITESLDLNARRLNITMPQNYLKPRDWLSTSPRLWDDGIPAIMVNYRLNDSRQHSDYFNNKSQFLSIDSSFNFGGWRLRQSGNWSASSRNNGRWQPLNVYVQHDYSLFQGGQLTLGQTSTDGSVFDSFPLEGIQIASDDGMIASELSQYSPVVRGIAYTQADVYIKQNGLLIYQKSVPAGMFEIRDFNPVYSGDLEIEIRETNGNVRRFTQTMATLPILQREGRIRYNVALGNYRNTSVKNKMNSEPHFLQASSAIGLPNEYTIYAGGIKADNYTSGLIGVGKYSDFWGAVSFDVTHASSEFSQRYSSLGTQNGQSYRFMYSRGFGDSNTTLNITGYRYATRGYYSFNELQQLENLDLSDRKTRAHHERSSIQTIVSQDFKNLGRVNLSANKDEYWDGGSGYNLNASHAMPFKYFSTLFSVGLNKNPSYKNVDKSLYFTLSIPIGKFTGGSNNLTSNTMTYNGRTQQMFGLSGVLQDNKLNYNLTQGWKNQGVGSAVNLNLNYLSSYANMNGNYLYQQDVRQWSYGINGGITLHENGITLSQPLSLNGSAALVRAEDASDVKVLNNSSIYTDWRGYAVVPSLSAYNRNQISLDVNTLGDDAELQNTDVTVIPSRGALVAADFRVNIGNKAMITLLQKNGKPIPFGSLVSLISKNKTNTGIVADLGQVYMSGLPSHGVLNVKWGETDENECKVGFNLKKSVNKYSEITLRCN